MNNKNIKVIIGLGLVIILTIIALVFIFRKPKTTSQPQTQQKETSNLRLNQPQDRFGIRNFTGKITKATANTIEGVASDGSNFILNISDSKKANFIKQTKQEDGTILVESVGLLDVPLNQDVDIQYDGKDNSLMLVVVK